MFKFIWCLPFIGLLIVIASAKINVHTLADEISQKVSDLIDKISNLPETVEKQEFLVSSEALQKEKNNQQNSISPSLVDLYLIEPQLEQLVQEVEDYKGSSVLITAFTSFVPTSVDPSVASTCAKVDESKTQIESYPPEQCLGYKLLPRLTDCQELCAALKLQMNINQINYSTELLKCESATEVWKLLSSTKLDKATLDRACNDIKAIGSDIERFVIAQCFKEPVSNDQRILDAICTRLQQDYDKITEKTLQTSYDDVVSKTEELDQKWNDFKAAEIAKPYSPVPVVSDCVPTKAEVENGYVNYYANLLNPTSNPDFDKRVLIENIANIGYNTSLVDGIFNSYQKFIELMKSDKTRKCDLEDASMDIKRSVDASLSSQKGVEHVLIDETSRKNPMYADFFKYYDESFNLLYAAINDPTLVKEFSSSKSGILATNVVLELLNIQKKLLGT